MDSTLIGRVMVTYRALWEPRAMKESDRPWKKTMKVNGKLSFLSP